MFIGHFGVGFGARTAQPTVSLGTFFLAVQFLDLLWPTLLLLGLEQVEIKPGITTVTPLDFTSYPISHSLLTVLGWGISFGFIHWLVRKNGWVALILGLCVVSHWLLDLVVHRPDLPLYPGNSPKLGLGLWNSMVGTQVAEVLLFGVGVGLYLRATEAKNKSGQFGLWGLIAFLLFIHVSNLMGPPPSSVPFIAWAGHLQWLIVIWGYWVDSNRVGRLPDAKPVGKLS